MTDRSLTPGDAEMIAAFLDRRLSSSERAAFLERLDSEPALYEVFVETARYRESLAAGESNVIPHPSRKAASWFIPGSIAALLAIAVVGPFLLEDADISSGAGLARGLVDRDRLEGKLEPDWIEQGWRRTRGVSVIRSEVDSAFRIGVHAIDLEVALRMKRRDDATLLLRYIDHELQNIDLSDHLQLSYAEILRELEAGQPLDKALQRSVATEPQALELLDMGYGYAFGKWAEAGKLAAASGNRQLLHSRTFRKMLGEIREHEWTEEVDRQLDVIESMVGDRNAKLDFEALEEAFTAIINES